MEIMIHLTCIFCVYGNKNKICRAQNNIIILQDMARYQSANSCV